MQNNIIKTLGKGMKNNDLLYKQRRSILISSKNVSIQSKQIKKSCGKNELLFLNKYGESKNKRRIPLIKRIPLNKMKQTMKNKAR